MRSIAEIRFDQWRSECRRWLCRDRKAELDIEMAAALEAETAEERKARLAAEARTEAGADAAPRRVHPKPLPVVRWDATSPCDPGALVVPAWQCRGLPYVTMDVHRSGLLLRAMLACDPEATLSAPIDDWRLATREEIAAATPSIPTALAAE